MDIRLMGTWTGGNPMVGKGASKVVGLGELGLYVLEDMCAHEWGAVGGVRRFALEGFIAFPPSPSSLPSNPSFFPSLSSLPSPHSSSFPPFPLSLHPLLLSSFLPSTASFLPSPIPTPSSLPSHVSPSSLPSLPFLLTLLPFLSFSGP